ncbi:hypothetical protein [Micromonospora sagamiensis]|uniref:Uncharacterized protein n=1 Tax=Micromonospora sagamiensis TaxID=47875 RepID=A0A562WLJ0_9ACTN|nr:hypothetical protein [Micromonospora sagamiensis]TWJ31159.1 hypothetical protein JD81_04713 [Micromonospora sagamiensis]BCL15796.1 hypothetical protein GCM10017556_35350 [Micromonospora sagamiensis]
MTTTQPDDGPTAVPAGVPPAPEADTPDSPGSYVIRINDGRGIQINVGGNNTQHNLHGDSSGTPPGAPATAPVDAREEGRLPRLPRRTARVAVVAAVTLALIGGAGYWWSSRSESSPPSSTSLTPTPARTTGPPIWSARIANTPNGTFGYPGPFADSRHREPVKSFFEGNVLRIVCQERNGRLIKDRTTVLQSTVWYRLDSDIWVSSLYAELTPAEADHPPPRLPDCTY